MSATISHNRWKVAENDFATRIIIPDLKGFFDKLPALPKGRSLVIEPGTRSVLIEDGMLVGELYAGEYTLESFRERLRFWTNKQSTVFLTRSEEVPVESRLQNIPCADGVCFDFVLRWTTQMSDVLSFVHNLMGANESLSVDRLESLLAPTLHQAIRDTVGTLSYDELLAADIVATLSDGIRSRAEAKLTRYGLTWIDLQSANIKPQDGGVAERKGELWLSAREQHLQRAAVGIDHDGLKNRAEDVRKKVELRQALRAAVSDDKLKQIQNREEFKKAIDAVDHQKLLRTEERETLVEAYEARKEDREQLRSHLLATIDLRREQELDELRLALEHTVRMKSLEREIELTRLSQSADNEKWQHELEREREEAAQQFESRHATVKARWDRIREQRRQRRDDEWESLVHDQRADVIRTDLEVARANRQKQIALIQAELNNRLAQEKLDVQKRQDQWDLESKTQRSNSQLDRLQRVQEMNAQFAEKEQRLQLDMENLKADSSGRRELERIRLIGTLGTDALIATAGEANASILADLKRHEASQDAIKANATSNSAAELNEERLKLYERLNETERAKADAVSDAYKLAMQAQQASVNQMIGGLAQAATPMTPSNPPSLSSAANWYIAVDNQQSGPFSLAQIQQYIQSGQVNASTMVWKNGMPAWTAALQVPELSVSLASNPQPPPMPLPTGRPTT